MGVGVRCLLRQLLPLDDHLDVVLVISPRVIVAPPHGALVLAREAEVFAGGAGGGALIALLAP